MIGIAIDLVLEKLLGAPGSARFSWTLIAAFYAMTVLVLITTIAFVLEWSSWRSWAIGLELLSAATITQEIRRIRACAPIYPGAEAGGCAP